MSPHDDIVPRGTIRSARVSARVPLAIRQRVDEQVAELRRRGLAANGTELVEVALAHFAALDDDEVETAVRTHRTNSEGASR